MRFKRIFLGAIAGLLLLAVTACHHRNDNYQGYVEGNYAYLSAPSGGELKKIMVVRGDSVTEGKLLFKLDPQPEASQLLEAQGKLQQAQQTLFDSLKGQRPEFIASILAQRGQVAAQLNLDRKTLIRYRDLFKTGAIDKASVDQASAAYQTDQKKMKELDAKLAEAKLGARQNQILAYQAAVVAAQAAVKQAAWSLQQKTVTAPVAGRIFDTYYRVGEFVQAGHPVVSMLAPHNVKIIFFVAEPNLHAVDIGQKIKIFVDGATEPYSATVSYISDKAEYTPPVIYSKSSRKNLVYRVEARPDPQTALKLDVGQPVEVAL